MTTLSLGLSGRFRVQKFRNGKCTYDTGFFKNLIVNTGMDQIGKSNIVYSYAGVGSGNTPPAVTDTQLKSLIGSGSNVGVSSARIESELRYAVRTKVYTFPAGRVVGNISEVGTFSSQNLASSTTVMFSSALIKDAGGNPTSITVLSDEDLVVTWELWVKQPTVDFINAVGSVTFTTRSAKVDDTPSTVSWANSDGFIASTGASSQQCATGGISGITGSVAGAITTSAFTFTYSPYVDGSFEREYSITWATTAAVGAAIKSFFWTVGIPAFQTEMSVALPPKQNDQTLKFTFKLSWSRDSGPA